jgi:hypothetical protein
VIAVHNRLLHYVRARFIQRECKDFEVLGNGENFPLCPVLSENVVFLSPVASFSVSVACLRIPASYRGTSACDLQCPTSNVSYNGRFFKLLIVSLTHKQQARLRGLDRTTMPAPATTKRILRGLSIQIVHFRHFRLCFDSL